MLQGGRPAPWACASTVVHAGSIGQPMDSNRRTIDFLDSVSLRDLVDQR
jgi:hypothetical protein